MTHCRPTHDTVRKGHRTLTATWQQEDNLSKETSSLFLSTSKKSRQHVLEKKLFEMYVVVLICC